MSIVICATSQTLIIGTNRRPNPGVKKTTHTWTVPVEKVGQPIRGNTWCRACDQVRRAVICVPVRVCSIVVAHCRRLVQYESNEPFFSHSLYDLLIPTYTAVSEPLMSCNFTPAEATASYVVSRSSRCWGSILSASPAAMLKKEASNACRLSRKK